MGESTFFQLMSDNMQAIENQQQEDEANVSIEHLVQDKDDRCRSKLSKTSTNRLQNIYIGRQENLMRIERIRIKKGWKKLISLSTSR
jgi:hypothetical protein